MTTTLNRIRADKRVEHLDDERAIDNSIIVTLRQGWSFSQREDNRVSGADTATALRTLLSTAAPFAGPYTD